jgi:hypothetical protein
MPGFVDYPDRGERKPVCGQNPEGGTHQHKKSISGETEGPKKDQAHCPASHRGGAPEEQGHRITSTPKQTPKEQRDAEQSGPSRYSTPPALLRMRRSENTVKTVEEYCRGGIGSCSVQA